MQLSVDLELGYLKSLHLYLVVSNVSLCNYVSNIFYVLKNTYAYFA